MYKRQDIDNTADTGAQKGGTPRVAGNLGHLSVGLRQQRAAVACRHSTLHPRPIQPGVQLGHPLARAGAGRQYGGLDDVIAIQQNSLCRRRAAIDSERQHHSISTKAAMRVLS